MASGSNSQAIAAPVESDRAAIDTTDLGIVTDASTPTTATATAQVDEDELESEIEIDVGCVNI